MKTPVTVSTAVYFMLSGTCPAVGAGPAPTPAPPAPSLAQLQQEADEGNPGIRAAQARLEGARRVPLRVSAAPDPEIGLTYVNDGVSQFTLGESEFSSLALTWTQEVPYRGKLKRAGAVAEFDVERAAAELRLSRLEARTEVGQAYAELYRIDRASAIYTETATILGALAQAARSRYEVGNGIQENVLKAETEVLRLQAETARLEQDRVAAAAALAAALGRDSGWSVGEVTTLPRPSLPADPDAMVTTAVAGSAAVEAARAVVRRSEATVEAARLGTKPDWLWSAGYQNRGDLDPMVMAMIGLRLPIYGDRKQQQAALEAEDALRSARQDLVAIELKTAARARSVWASARRADRLIDLYEKGVVVQARAAVASAQSSYGVGRIDFLDLLNDLTVLLEVRIETATQEAERLKAMSELEALTGGTLVEPSSLPETAGAPR